MNTKIMISIFTLLLNFLMGIDHATAHINDSTDYLPEYAFDTRKLVLPNLDTIAYVDEGKGDQTLVFIHGLGGYIKHWEANIKTLSQNYRCIAIDLPCYGRSGKTVRATTSDYMDYFSETVIAVIDKLNAKRVTLVGHSMGGQIAMITALKAPKIIQQLILISPAGIETFTPMEAAGMKQFTPPSFFMNQKEKTIREALKKNFVSPPAAMDEMVTNRLKLKQSKGFAAYCQTVSNSIKGMLDHPVYQELSAIKQKTLIIYGAQDQLIPNRILHGSLTIQQVAESANTQIPNSTLILMSKAGHLLQMEKSAETNKSIQQFLTE